MILHKRVQLMIGLLVALFSVACVFLPTPTPASAPTPTSTLASPPEPTSTPSPTSTPDMPSSEAWQATVDALVALHQSAGYPPEHLLKENAVRTGDEFDVNRYFTVLDHLSMEPGYTLDYVYCYDGSGFAGFPKLYARPDVIPTKSATTDTPPTGDQPWYLTCSDVGGSADSYLAHVQVDGTEEGFFQFAVLRLMGGQFYLHWHAGYRDTAVVCDRETVESIISDDGISGQPFSAEQKQAARAIDPAPVVEMEDDVVTVKVVVFSKWGGFERATFRINRSFPYAILGSEFETLVEYDCGIMF